MKIVIDINGKLGLGDILVYDGNNLIPVNKKSFLAQITAENKALKESIAKLKTEIDEFRLKVNEKLKDYHNVLQTLTKEE